MFFLEVSACSVKLIQNKENEKEICDQKIFIVQVFSTTVI